MTDEPWKFQHAPARKPNWGSEPWEAQPSLDAAVSRGCPRKAAHGHPMNLPPGMEREKASIEGDGGGWKESERERAVGAVK